MFDVLFMFRIAIAEGTAFAPAVVRKRCRPYRPKHSAESTVALNQSWRDFVGLAARVSPDEAVRVIEEVPDPEIHAFLRVALASSLMGAEPTMVHPVIRNQDHEIKAVW